MFRDSTVDHYSIPFALKAVSKLKLPTTGTAIHAQSCKLGLDRDVFVANSLANMYFGCRLVGFGSKVFDFGRESGVSDVVSWNTVISGYLHNNLNEESLRLFMEMVKTCVGAETPDKVTLVNGLVTCGRLGRIGFCRQIHGYAVANSVGVDFFLGSSLIDVYAKCGMVEDARKVFDRMPKKNIVCWTSMVSGYNSVDMFLHSVELFRTMQTQGVRVDDTTISCVLSACANLGALDQGKWVCAYCDAHGLVSSLKVKTALVDMYSKCGDIVTATLIFYNSSRRDIYLWSVMICGLAMNGRPEEALHLFSEMQQLRDVKPNDVTFLGILSACCHGGLLEKGFHYFHCMVNVYNLTPKIQHYGCMVDLLGRARLLKEAEEFIKRMPIQPDAVIWRSLLFACRRSGDVERAEHAVQRIMELEPSEPGMLVLLSNVYASASKWSDASKLRRNMQKSGIRKQPGCSFIEVEGIVHEFLVADSSHEQTMLIHECLLRISDHTSSEGHGSCSEFCVDCVDF